MNWNLLHSEIANINISRIHGDSLVWRCKWPVFTTKLWPKPLKSSTSACSPSTNLRVPPQKRPFFFRWKLRNHLWLITSQIVAGCFWWGMDGHSGGSALRFSWRDGHPLVVVSAGLKGHPFRCPETTMLKNRGKSKMNKIWKKDGKTRE